MVCPRRMSFSQFVVHMSTTNCEKDSLLGQTIPSPEPFLFFENPCFFLVTLYQVRDVESVKVGENLLRAVKHFNSYNLGSRS